MDWDGTAFRVANGYAIKDELKAAGFRWDKPSLSWYTYDHVQTRGFNQLANERCKLHLEKLEAQDREMIEASRALTSDAHIPAPPGCEYRPFQIAGIETALRMGSCLLGDQMGLGKSIQALGVINCLPEVQNILIVCPGRLKPNWQIESLKWLLHPDIEIVQATSDYFPAPPQRGAQMVIINYEILTPPESRKRQKNAVPEAGGKKVKKIIVPRQGLTERLWDVIIYDECQRIKNSKTQQTKAALAIKGRRKLFLSGTPFLNRPSELWTIINAINPHIWNSWWEFVHRYCGAKKTRFGLDTDGATNRDELNYKLRSTLMIRRLVEDVLPELPPRTYQLIEMPTTPDIIAREQALLAKFPETVRELKRRVKAAAHARTEEEYNDAVGKLKSCGMPGDLAAIMEIRHETTRAKLPLIIEHLKDAIESGSKIVFFAWFRDILEAVHKAFGEQSVLFYGGMHLDTTQRAIEGFQTKDSIRLFCGSFKAAGEGITLTASNHCVFGELDWVPGTIRQAEARLIRIGQHWPVLIQHLVLENSLDGEIAKILVDKQNILNEVLDAGR